MTNPTPIDQIAELVSRATKGPWAVHPAVAQVDAFDINTGNPLAVCEMLWPTDERTEAEAEANAALIALAPEMAARLIAAEGRLERIRAITSRPHQPLDAWLEIVAILTASADGAGR